MIRLNGKWKAAVAVFLIGLLGLLLCQNAGAQKTKGKTRLSETKYLMRGINQPNCAALGKVLKASPADDKAWGAVTQHASLLNEMGYLLMEDGRCPDKVWAGAAKTLRESSAKVLEAAKAKDVEAAQSAFKTLTGACAACHTAHKN